MMNQVAKYTVKNTASHPFLAASAGFIGPGETSPSVELMRRLVQLFEAEGLIVTPVAPPAPEPAA